jgi:opacity protein-like surface antigen
VRSGETDDAYRTFSVIVLWRACAALLSAAIASVAASAQVPEQLDQLELDSGEWQAEYFGTFRRGDGQDHALELIAGVSDRLAIGFELEGQAEGRAIRIENIGPKIQYRFTSRDAPVGVGLQIQAGFSSGALLTEVEARLIVEGRSAHWWGQADAILRRSAEKRDVAVASAYAWSLQYGLGRSVWLGMEGSGKLAGPGDAAHFIGPSVTFEINPASRYEIEVGLASLVTMQGTGSPAMLRIYVQLGL